MTHVEVEPDSSISSLIRMYGIKKSFGTNEVLKGIDLTVEAGSHTAILGPSGSGKSTLLRTINLLEKPTAGSLVIDGYEMGQPHEATGLRPAGNELHLRRTVGMVFQQFNLFPHLMAIDNVALALRSVRRMSAKDAREQAAIQLDRVGLIDRAGHYPDQLSGGQQQRVAIARALALEPKIMLFDEPTSALDPELVGEVLSSLQMLAGLGMTMIIVTHEIGFAREIADLTVFMDQGAIVETGGKEFYDHCRTPRAQAFIKAVK